jgi:hypothetical protein
MTARSSQVGDATATVASRLRGEFLEMSCMRLNLYQVRRLCGVPVDVCKTALDRLVAERFLTLTSDGCYVRITEG